MPLPAVLAGAPAAVMLADARAPAVLAGAPPAVMLADARAPAVLAEAPLAVMLAFTAPPLLCAHPLPLPRPRAPACRCCAITLCRCLPSLPPVGRILRLKILESFLGSISGDAKGTMFQDIQHFQSLHGQAGLGHHVGFKIPIPHGHHHRKHHHGGNCYPHKSW